MESITWNQYVVKKISKKFNLPVLIENEANAGAHGEKQFGTGHKFNDIIYASVGIGIGVVMVLIILLIA